MSSMQNNPITYSTTASRRTDRIQSMRGHKSKWPIVTEVPAVLREDGTMIPATTRVDWYHKTYNVGRNKFKNICRSLGLSRKKVERNMRAQEAVQS